MHKHPTPLQIKNEVIKAMVERFEDMPRKYVSAMFDAVNVGITQANINHHAFMEAMNNDQ